MERADCRSFVLREPGWKCKARQSRLERLSGLVVGLGWTGALHFHTPPRRLRVVTVKTSVARATANVSTPTDGIQQCSGGKDACAYSRVKGPTWRGARSLGEEQEVVVNMEDGEEEYGEEDADEESLLSVKTLEMATSTIP